jgi:hypothetical protein
LGVLFAGKIRDPRDFEDILEESSKCVQLKYRDMKQQRNGVQESSN